MEGTITEEEKKKKEKAEARLAKLEKGSEEHTEGLRKEEEEEVCEFPFDLFNTNFVVTEEVEGEGGEGFSCCGGGCQYGKGLGQPRGRSKASIRGV